MDTSHGFWDSFEDFELFLPCLFDLHDGSQIVASVAVVRSTPDSNQILVLEPMDIALLHKLMGPCNKFQSVDMAEVIGDLRSEYPSCSSGIDCPILNVLWVRPHQVTEGTFVGNLNFSIDGPYLVDCFDLRTQSSMDAEDLPVDDCANGEIIKDFSAVFPRIRVAVLPVDFIIESIDCGNLS